MERRRANGTLVCESWGLFWFCCISFDRLNIFFGASISQGTEKTSKDEGLSRWRSQEIVHHNSVSRQWPAIAIFWNAVYVEFVWARFSCWGQKPKVHPYCKMLAMAGLQFGLVLALKTWCDIMGPSVLEGFQANATPWKSRNSRRKSFPGFVAHHRICHSAPKKGNST